ncbi:hypothetical protein BBBOND_0103540 [Babesia bigemina]|uniref:6-Cys domain-containing protein n=1 Tax=Babesia bigemina TaxID=5866 RepID=A0A061D8G7_BABBI|nr:hypothetical protein BBBOND_0103540 [Babesia bigemina]CDR94040.1 hypothetical protein BBBOND_0103540 [Babesia bigemina]|eukprot:XP_012766226.1 hypothetical protein BBBOND_0103540 [Babesia bigemina]
MMWFSVLVGAALACVCAVENAFARTPHGRPPAPPLIFTGKSGSIKYEVTLDRVTLGQPHEANIVCGNDDGTPLGGEFTLYPSDPMTKTLLPLEGDDLEEAISKEVLLRNISRSTMLQIETSKHRGTGSFVKVKYPINALIMAKDPHNFSINYACKYQPHDKSQPPYYKWLEIKFKYVYPMAYGCESGNDMLFKNSVYRFDSYKSRAQHAVCRINPEPNLLFGIYCKPGEVLFPEDCVSKHDMRKLGGLIERYELDDKSAAAIRGYEVHTRLKLFKISPKAMDKEFSVSCQCMAPDGEGRQLSLRNHVNVEVNPVQTLQYNTRSLQHSMAVMELLRPGIRLTISAPPNGRWNVGYLGNVESNLTPTDPTHYVTIGPGKVKNTLMRIHQFIGAKKLSIAQHSTVGKLQYVIHYKPDSVWVLKNEMQLMHYKWRATRMDGPKPVDVSVDVNLPIIPTDPHTYGCGVDSRDLFRYEGFELHQGKHEYETVCKINPYVLSPVGFYCPKHYTLEPAGCFGEMLHTESGRVVNLADYAPHANPINSANIRVLDFHVPKSMRRRVKYSNDELSCRCLDPDGRVHASITLDLRQPMTDKNPPAVK